MEISLNLVHLTENHALCLSTEGKSPKTIEWYTANLKRFAPFLIEVSLLPHPELVPPPPRVYGFPNPFCVPLSLTVYNACNSNLRSGILYGGRPIVN